MRRIPVFFYGLFMDPELLQARGLQPAQVGRASVSGMTLRIGERAALVPDPRAQAFGMVMHLTHDEIERLYSDPGVRAYRPEPLLVALEDGSSVPALCFNLPVPPGADERNETYAGKLRDLATRLGLPQEYIATIR